MIGWPMSCDRMTNIAYMSYDRWPMSCDRMTNLAYMSFDRMTSPYYMYMYMYMSCDRMIKCTCHVIGWPISNVQSSNINFIVFSDVVLQSGTLDRAAAEKFAKMQRNSRGIYDNIIFILLISHNHLSLSVWLFFHLSVCLSVSFSLRQNKVISRCCTRERRQILRTKEIF